MDYIRALTDRLLIAKSERYEASATCSQNQSARRIHCTYRRKVIGQRAKMKRKKTI